MSMMGKLMKMNSKGDTIVEVLLAIAVAGTVLGGAFVSARHSLSGSQRTQERSEATKLVEGQMEYLRKAAVQSSAIFTAGAPFCIVSVSATGLTLRDATAAECRQGINSRYALSINRGADNATFRIQASWDKANAGGSDEINMYYKVHQGDAP
jgi:type II secretory pathway pseudopilin PulG